MTQEKFKLLYAYPPWSYSNSSSNGAASSHYQLLSMGDLMLVMDDKLKDSLDYDCVLVLWVVSPMLQEGMDLMKSWGFQYKTVLFNWHKLTKHGKPFFGAGNYTRAGSEICLLGIRGKGVPRQDASIRQVVTDNVREHSRKPDIIREHLVSLFGDVPRMELFARSTHEGWVNHGDQVDHFDIKTGQSDEVIPDMSFLE